MRDVLGYITEKIFDSFAAWCVPVYWGASNVTDYIPEGCFIDRRKFRKRSGPLRVSEKNDKRRIWAIILNARMLF